MADIFISYKRESLWFAKALAARLMDSGWSVWWDRNIPAGKPYDQVIEEELARARCVIVVWTTLSVNSLNVKEEAMEGFKRNILIPIALGHVPLPYGFKMIQTLFWNEAGNISDEHYQELANQVRQLIGAPTGEQGNAAKEDVGNAGKEPSHTTETSELSATPEFTKQATLHFTKPNHLASLIDNKVASLISNKISLKAIEASVKIYIDGQMVGNLLNNEEFTISVRPGNHFLQIKGGGSLYGTSKHIIVRPGEDMTLKIGFSVTGGLVLSEV